MSTRFYGYRVERSEFWGFLDKVRDYYYREGPLMEIAHDVSAQVDAADDDERSAKFHEALDFFSEDNKRARELTVEVQVFEEDAEHFIFRVLEFGYTFMNRFEAEGWPVEPVFYDNGSDVSPEEEAVKPIVDRIDAMIDMRRYFVTPVVSIDDASMWMSEIDESPAARADRARSRYGDEVVARILDGASSSDELVAVADASLTASEVSSAEAHGIREQERGEESR